MSKKDLSHIELETFWPYHVIVLADQISRHTHHAAKTKAGLNLSQWRVLAAVVDKPGRTAAEVAKITPMDKTIVSRAVSSLIELGVIQKASRAEDKRRHALTATASGLEIYEKIATYLNQTMVSLFPEYAQQEALIEDLKGFSAKMSKMLEITRDN